MIASYFAVEKSMSNEASSSSVSAAVWALTPHGLNHAATDGESHFTPGIEADSVRTLIDGAFYGDEWAQRSALVREYDWSSKWAAATGSQMDAPKITNAECLAVMASESDLRMFVQQGAFTVHSFGLPALDQDQRFAGHLRKYVIEAEHVAGFARELEACGLSEAGIYPDLDNLSRELERTQRGVGARNLP